MLNLHCLLGFLFCSFPFICLRLWYKISCRSFPLLSSFSVTSTSPHFSRFTLILFIFAILKSCCVLLRHTTLYSVAIVSYSLSPTPPRNTLICPTLSTSSPHIAFHSVPLRSTSCSSVTLRHTPSHCRLIVYTPFR